MINELDKHAASLPAYTELRLHNNYSSSLMMRKGSLIENRQSQHGGISARCCRGGAFGFASVPGGNDNAVRQAIAQATTNVELFKRTVGHNMGALPSTAPGTGTYDYRTSKPRFSAGQRVDIVRAIDAYVAKTYPALVNADVMLSSLAMEKALVTSEGARTYSYVPRANLFLKFSIQANDGIVDLYDVYGGFGDLEEQFERIDWIYRAIDDLYEDLRHKADGAYCEAGTHDVILDTDVAGILAHEAIGHTCEADLVLGGSVAGANLGKQVASEKFNLVDYGQRGPDDNASIAIHVDDEGTPCRDVTIIENGVLKEFLNNKETAQELGVEPTGNARAYTFSDEPLVRMRNTAIVPGPDRLEEMVAAIDKGYYLKRSTNGQADATSEFMFGISLGYEIRNGKLGRAIRDTTISGVAFDMLKTISHVSGDMTWSKGGMCGKKQLIPVGMGGPAIKCRINVGGR
ncbi:MAG: TldD/PmbA family protein [Gammaproteobacteria bacterium]